MDYLKSAGTKLTIEEHAVAMLQFQSILSRLVTPLALTKDVLIVRLFIYQMSNGAEAVVLDDVSCDMLIRDDTTEERLEEVDPRLLAVSHNRFGNQPTETDKGQEKLTSHVVHHIVHRTPRLVERMFIVLAVTKRQFFRTHPHESPSPLESFCDARLVAVRVLILWIRTPNVTRAFFLEIAKRLIVGACWNNLADEHLLKPGLLKERIRVMMSFFEYLGYIATTVASKQCLSARMDLAILWLR
jgi:hypothetical protein